MLPSPQKEASDGAGDASRHERFDARVLLAPANLRYLR
jgi:hypothetical protein